MYHLEITAGDRAAETADLAYTLEGLFSERQHLYLQIPEIAFQIIQDLSSVVRKETQYFKQMISSVNLDGFWVPLSQVDTVVVAQIVSNNVAHAAFHYEAISNEQSRFSVDHGLHSMSRILLAKCFENIQLNDYYLSQFADTTKALTGSCGAFKNELMTALDSSQATRRIIKEVICGGLTRKGWLRNLKRQAGSEIADLIQRNSQIIQNRFHISTGEALAFSQDEAAVCADINANLTRMMEINEGILYSVSRPYLKGSFDREEILSEGRNGFLRACVKFNPRNNASFYSFAKRWIVQRIVSHIDSQSSILTVCQETGSNYRKVKKFRAEAERSGDNLSVKQAALAAGCSIRELDAMDYAYRPTESIDGFTENEEKSSVSASLGSDDFSPENDLEASEAVSAVNTLLEHLSPREGHILRGRYGIGCSTQTLEELSRTLEISCEGIRQAQIRAEKKLAEVATRLGFGLESFFIK